MRYSSICLVAVYTAIGGHCVAVTSNTGPSITLQEKAIVPTTSGQIGVNPVTDIGEASADEQPWIGVNTEYLTDGIVTITTTTSGKKSTTTAARYASASAVQADGNGFAKGDFAVRLSKAASNALKSSADSISTACGGAKRKRSTTACVTRIVQAAQQSEGEYIGTIRLIGESIEAGEGVAEASIPAGTLMALPAWVTTTEALVGLSAAQAVFVVTMGAYLFNKEQPAEVKLEPIGTTSSGCKTTQAPRCTSSCSVYPYAEDYSIKTSTSCEKSMSCNTISVCNAKSKTTTTTATATEALVTVTDTDIVYDPDNASQSPFFVDWPTSTTTTSASASPTLSCGDASNKLLNTEDATKFASTFCDAADFSKDTVSKTSDKNSNGATIKIDYSKTGTCLPDKAGCIAALGSVIKRCEYDSHSYNKIGTYNSTCGNYKLTPQFPATTTTSATASATATGAGPRLKLKMCNAYTNVAHFKSSDVKTAIQKQCKTLISQKTKISSPSGAWVNAGTWSGSFKPGIDATGGSTASEVAISIYQDRLACPDQSKYELDFGSMTLDDCTNTWMTPVTACSPSGSSDDKKTGGSYFDRCAQWVIGPVAK